MKSLDKTPFYATSHGVSNSQTSVASSLWRNTGVIPFSFILQSSSNAQGNAEFSE